MVDMEPTPDPSPAPIRRMSRRTALGTGGGATLALLLAACSDGAESGSPSTSTTAAGSGTSTTTAAGSGEGEGSGTTSGGTPSTTVFRAADFAALGACLLSPEQTEGPYPTVTQIERRDIREDLAGHPLRLGLQVVDESCEPIPGAVVEIWHCDTDGDYSAYADCGTQDDAGEGTTFLRGSQTANDEGIVEFISNYPGWYRGRAVHIHTKVHLDDSTVLTSQIYFEDELNSEIFRESPYRGDPDTTNTEDSVSRGDPASNGTQAFASEDAQLAGTRALLVLGVDPNASSARSGRGDMGGPGGGGSGGGPAV